MRCIFCKTQSDNSKSVEHIIPQSLGNIDHVLPPGIVCDKCNNYFSIKLEKPLLESLYFLHTRFENLIPSKKGKVPAVKGYLPKSMSIVDIEMTTDGLQIVLDKDDVSRFLESATGKGSLYILHPKKPRTENKRLFSRFLGKIAIEVLAQRALRIPNAIEIDVIDKIELDELRDYARYGKGKEDWPYYQRKIYPAGAMFLSEEDGEYYDIPHEYNLLYTEENELYFVVIIFGIEYTINMGGPEIEGYQKWLHDNDNKSPLYLDGVNYEFTRDSIVNLGKGSIIDVVTRK